MAYTVLARRYRSGTFDEVVGQEHVARTLKRAIESDRLAHAFLFCGTRGVGKTSMARILAKALNCDKAKKPTAEPCGECTSCKSITRGDDMDVIEIDAASNTGVDNVREIIENSRFRPARARFKVYIIDEVHMLSKGAFNALLKTLEEPPEHVKFILATTETEKVPATILSRCQRYDFRNIPTREIAAHLTEVTKKEKVKADEDALLLVARAGAGSMRDALSLLDRLLSLGEKTLTVEMIEQLLGMPKAQAIFDLAQHIGEADVKKTLESADRLIRDGLSSETLVASLADHCRNLLLIATCGAESDLVEVAGQSLKELSEQARQFDTIALTQSIAILEDLRRSLRQTSAGRAMLDATLVRLALAEQFTKLETLLAGGDASAGAAQKKKSDLAGSESSFTSRGVSDPPRNGATHAAREVVREQFQSPPELESAPESSTAADDALPAVGKVFEGAKRSLGAIFAASRGAPARAPAQQSNVETVEPNEFSPIMHQLRSAMRQHGSGYEGILVHGQIVSVGNGQATIRYGHQHEASARMLERNGKREAVQQVLSELLKEDVGLTIEVEPESADTRAAVETAPAPRGNYPRLSPRDMQDMPAPPPAAAAPVLSAEQKQKILETDPLVRATVELFGGDIVKAD